MDSIHPEGVTADLAALDDKVNALLPPRYQHCYTSVSPNSMGSAGLKYAWDGSVAWDQIWTTFCDLALAGGPPHRGRLLEPASEAEVEANSKRCAEVIAEIARGIALTTGLQHCEGYSPGWMGVQCESPEQAAWFQFAVTAENVSARRRDSVLQLPIGPKFYVEKEIKNVIVALAKSNHYWDGHLTDSQQTLAGLTVWEPATPHEAVSARPDYDAAIDEVEAAFRSKGVHVLPRRYVGWVGIRATSDEDAVWLLRAVLAERVLARREENVVFLPVGAKPDPNQAAKVAHAASEALRLWKASVSAKTL